MQNAPADMTGTEVIARLRATPGAAEVQVLLWDGADFVRAMLLKADGRFYVQRWQGGSMTTLYNATRTALDTRVRLRLQGGTLTVFEGASQRVSQAWPLTSTTVFPDLNAKAETSGAGQVDRADFVFARKYDGVDPTVTVGSASATTY